MSSNGRARTRAWSLRLADPLFYEPIVSLANACKRSYSGIDLIPRSEDETEELCADERFRPKSSPLVEPISAREMEVLSAICDGDSNEDISRKLGIGLSTVKYHATQIFGKLGVQRRTQAVAVAIYLGLVQPDWLPDYRTRNWQ